MTIHYGMAQWQHPAWVNWLYPTSLPTAERIGRYSQVFSTVEVGSTFYTKVDDAQLLRWYESVAGDFRFSFKAPQTVTHRLIERPWCDVQQDWFAFMLSLQPLQAKLGPTMLQFPAICDERALDTILALCDMWTLSTPLSVEVRNLAYFDKSQTERRFLTGLSERNVNRVVMDSRPVFSTEAYCESLVDAQKKKPRVPCHPVATANHPVVRFIGHPDLPRNEFWLGQWAAKLSQWLSEGLTPSVFVHSSDNIAAPTLAAQLDEKVRSLTPSYQKSLALPQSQEQVSLW
ncbi:Uncharacterized conserved protein YecE, DUF72 family [Marinomonas polaris DSM 16579]|uniref:Uncharacterized conserved protein YecE, DUF72 family n=1 Tax=Marinomonas polaris DSM 16579 TaxID=1122206 RepID=A0A1M5KCD3_9GAMM|nr:DUF72 domain-containing protein [Marinomonas polaris]SHG50516.1 Uncharacterized conserved protein YecE, DUF72 family [Marinomonas polaris DSM 16579]|tara:strand:+ start:10727 stop:11590 length:864 start_codon:yes stop_codon:yes gene_type:complete